MLNVNVKFERVGNGGYATAESPVYNPFDGKFYFVDIEGKKVGCFDPSTKNINHYDMGELVGGIVPCGEGLLVAKKDGFFIFDLYNKSLRLIAQIEVDKPGNRPNDIALVECSDGKTRVFLGTMPLNSTATPKSGSLLVLDPDSGSLIKLRDDLTTSNGIAGYSENGVTTLFFSDSHPLCRKIFKATFDPKTNTIKSEEVFKEMPINTGRPDGGNLALVNEKLCHVIAAIDSGKILFHDVVSAELLAEIQLPAGVKKVTKCAISPSGQIFVTTLNPDDKSGRQDPLRLHGELYMAELPPHIKGYNCTLFAHRVSRGEPSTTLTNPQATQVVQIKEKAL